MAHGEILLVEDRPDDERLTIRALKKANLLNDITVVRDGAEALDYLFCTGRYADRAPREPPAAVLLDLDLPKINGIGVLRRLRTDERTRLIPVVVLTSSAQQRDVVESYGFGACSYVGKPLTFGGFAEAVQNLGLCWLLNLGTREPANRA